MWKLDNIIDEKEDTFIKNPLMTTVPVHLIERNWCCFRQPLHIRACISPLARRAFRTPLCTDRDHVNSACFHCHSLSSIMCTCFAPSHFNANTHNHRARPLAKTPSNSQRLRTWTPKRRTDLGHCKAERDAFPTPVSFKEGQKNGSVRSSVTYLQDDTASGIKIKADNNVRRLDWPAQSPDLNPIEHFWDELDRRVRDRQARPKSIAQLMEWLQEEWRRIPVDVLQTLVESMPDRVAAVIVARDTLKVKAFWWKEWYIIFASLYGSMLNLTILIQEGRPPVVQFVGVPPIWGAEALGSNPLEGVSPLTTKYAETAHHYFRRCVRGAICDRYDVWHCAYLQSVTIWPLLTRVCASYVTPADEAGARHADVAVVKRAEVHLAVGVGHHERIHETHGPTTYNIHTVVTPGSRTRGTPVGVLYVGQDVEVMAETGDLQSGNDVIWAPIKGRKVPGQRPLCTILRREGLQGRASLSQRAEDTGGRQPVSCEDTWAIPRRRSFVRGRRRQLGGTPGQGVFKSASRRHRRTSASQLRGRLDLPTTEELRAWSTYHSVIRRQLGGTPGQGVFKSASRRHRRTSASQLRGHLDHPTSEELRAWSTYHSVLGESRSHCRSSVREKYAQRSSDSKIVKKPRIDYIPKVGSTVQRRVAIRSVPMRWAAKNYTSIVSRLSEDLSATDTVCDSNAVYFKG
ncbi:hypothetical protein PR048_023172 [Dryococelus australis]|uniref:Transposase n=1 Tax=Dryococelus australis TaxID=614101 RepID=A0ABQ9GTD2_9NEOP|nr:hypothetical protein PR048_023172 [Dryococelus australis]